jgi:hypothetical protein
MSIRVQVEYKVVQRFKAAFEKAAKRVKNSDGKSARIKLA